MVFTGGPKHVTLDPDSLAANPCQRTRQVRIIPTLPLCRLSCGASSRAILGISNLLIPVYLFIYKMREASFNHMIGAVTIGKSCDFKSSKKQSRIPPGKKRCWLFLFFLPMISSFACISAGHVICRLPFNTLGAQFEHL